MYDNFAAPRSDYLLALPVFNEEHYVEGVLREVRQYSRDILVVDDGSTDQTPALLRRDPGIRVIRHAENRGYGKSIADAFDFALSKGYRFLITMDCDEQHEPACIPKLLGTVRTGDADVVSGTRYPDGHDTPGPAPADRRRINRCITRLINRTLGLGITDAFCGFKAYRVAALRRLDITVPGYAMPMQFWVQVARAGLRVRELPVPLIYHDPNRQFGGILDDPSARLRHYLEVFEAELVREQPLPFPSATTCLSFR